MGNLVRVKCPGYTGRADSLGLTGMPIRCPELSRRAGHRPGNPGKGYPENWDKRCVTCDNTGTIYMERADEVVNVPYY